MSKQRLLGNFTCSKRGLRVTRVLFFLTVFLVLAGTVPAEKVLLGENSFEVYSEVVDNDMVILSAELEFSQSQITGKVIDENGRPLTGVTVSLRGNSSIGTTTDENGNYALTVADNNVTLVFSSVGFVSQEIPVNGRSVVDTRLISTASELEQVVVVGYGTQRRSEVVGSVGEVGSKDFGDVATNSASQLLQGKIAGVQIVNSSGIPGADVNIVIRGTGSFTNVSPLYVIDGIQSTSEVFNSISPSDIESISVLKDASSVAIYGAQGANGVVIITTKRPKNGAPRVNYSGYFGISKPWRKFDMMNAEEYVSIVKEWYDAQGQPLPPRVASPEALVTRTDWQDEMFRTGHVNNHNINVSGGSEKFDYSASIGYVKHSGVINGPDFQRLNMRVNLVERLGKRIKLGQQLVESYQLRRGAAPSIMEGLRMPPYIPAYDPTNELGGFGIAQTALDGNDAFNPLIIPSLYDTRNRRFINYLQLYGEIDLIPGLKFRTQFGGNLNFNQNYTYYPTHRVSQLVRQNQITEAYSYNLRYIFENYFTYNKKFGMHSIDATLGSSYRDGGVSRSVSLTGSSFPNDQIHQIGAAQTIGFNSGLANSNARFISYFGRVNYILNSKYILTLTGRRDATSLFAPDRRVGYFPSIGLGWRVSQEAFMENVEFVTDLKLRGSWGRTGNSNIPGYMYQSNIWTGSGNSVVYPLGTSETLANGATVAVPASPELQWEKTRTIDVGLDAMLFNNRVSLSLGYYDRNNEDLLVSVPLPPSDGFGGVSGASSSQLINAASAYNKGFEFTIGYNGSLGDLNYSVGVNGNYNKNQVTSLGTEGANPIIAGDFFDVHGMTRTDIGHPIGAFYGFVYDHVAIDQHDIDTYNQHAQQITGDPAAVYQAGLLPGDRIFEDVNGDGVVTDADQTYLGSSIPKWLYGFNLSMNYHNFDFMASLEGIAGVNLIEAMKYYNEGFFRPFNGKTTVLTRWQKDGDITDITKPGQNAGTGANLRPSSWYVESGAYARLRNVTLGYTFTKEKLGNSLGTVVSSIRLYVTGQNLLTFTGYKGYDPEIGAGNFIFSRGIDTGNTPQARTVLFGLQVGF